MVRFIALTCALIVLLSFANAEDENPKEFKCYTCTDCESVKDTDSKKCEKAVCFTETKDDKTTRGCEDEKYCNGKDSCTECIESNCNSGSAITASLMLGVGAAMLLKLYY